MPGQKRRQGGEPGEREHSIYVCNVSIRGLADHMCHSITYLPVIRRAREREKEMRKMHRARIYAYVCAHTTTCACNFPRKRSARINAYSDRAYTTYGRSVKTRNNTL